MTHTFIERKDYEGVFLPGFVSHFLKETLVIPKKSTFRFIDHIVTNRPEGDMEPTA
jgi:hypothetical protein